jgi:Protein of unknown function (DUF3618)
MTSPEIQSAREQVEQTRAELSSTLSELSARVSAPVTAVKQKLNVVNTVRENPWVALAVAVGAGVAVASTGADARAASAAADAARAAASKAKSAGQATLASAREAPARAKGGVGSAVDALATNLVLSFINGLRKPMAPPDAQLPLTALGVVRTATPAHEEARPAEPERSV